MKIRILTVVLPEEGLIKEETFDCELFHDTLMRQSIYHYQRTDLPHPIQCALPVECAEKIIHNFGDDNALIGTYSYTIRDDDVSDKMFTLATGTLRNKILTYILERCRGELDQVSRTVVHYAVIKYTAEQQLKQLNKVHHNSK